MKPDFRSIVESSPDGILVITDGLIVYVNEETERLLGYSRTELLNQPLEVLLPDSLREKHKGQRENYEAQPTRRPMGKLPGILARRRDGSHVPVDISLSPMGGNAVVASIRDISQTVRINRELKELADSLAARVAERDRQAAILYSVVNSIADGVLVLDAAGRVQIVNPAAMRMYPAAGLDAGNASFVNVARESGALLPDKTTPYPADERLLTPVRNGRHVDRAEVFVRPSPAADGVWTTITARPLSDGNGTITGAVLAIRDITERKLAQETLLAGQEAERKRIARELHDSVCQTLCASILELEKTLAETPESAGEFRRQVEAQKEVLAELADEVSSVAHRLHPAVLERVGLAEAMQRICREFDRKGLPVEFSQRNMPAKIAAPSALCLYRVAQEALRNAKRHGMAPSAKVSLDSDGATLRLSIADTGIGFDPDEAMANGGLGLVSMRERVRLAGGALSIRSRRGHGARIEVNVPVGRDPARAATA